MAGREGNGFHIALDTLWNFRADNITLSQEELNHLYGCNECLNCLSLCQSCETIEQARELQQGKLKRLGD